MVIHNGLKKLTPAHLRVLGENGFYDGYCYDVCDDFFFLSISISLERWILGILFEHLSVTVNSFDFEKFEFDLQKNALFLWIFFSFIYFQYFYIFYILRFSDSSKNTLLSGTIISWLKQKSGNFTLIAY